MTTTEQTREFESFDRDTAIGVATKWCLQLTQRASLSVTSILAVERDGRWVATVAFSEAADSRP
jgi:hypothetical protein